MFKKPLNFINHEKRNLEIRHSDDSRHSDGYSDHLGRHQLHGCRLRRKQPLQTGEAVFVFAKVMVMVIVIVRVSVIFRAIASAPCLENRYLPWYLFHFSGIEISLS